MRNRIQGSYIITPTKLTPVRSIYIHIYIFNVLKQRLKILWASLSRVRVLVSRTRSTVLEVCSFSPPAFFSPFVSQKTSGSKSIIYLVGWCRALALLFPGVSLEDGRTFLPLKLFPFSWAHKDRVDKNLLNGSKEPNVCFCILWCFVWLQLITNTLPNCNIQLSLFFLGEEEPSHPISHLQTLTLRAPQNFNRLKPRWTGCFISC